MGEKPKRRPQPSRRKIPDANGVISHVRYSRAVGEEICRRISEGKLWHQIAGKGDMPSYDCLYRWRRRHPEFAEALEMAREMAADLKAEKALAVAEATTAATVTADRLKVSTFHWHAARGAPQRYGAKAEERPAEPQVTYYIRRFEKYVGEDGRTYVREVPREPKRRRK
ncbi:terminase small subunit-like protein [Phenylobacterium zucineum]|uniref:terminase small subunit-like protein n=1 Tax=Phenylobacterium zucineum TaxID=284016 RepID=UPI0003132FA7|nr:hypothetical protein [Phenylobacterium zucineum]